MQTHSPPNGREDLGLYLAAVARERPLGSGEAAALGAAITRGRAAERELRADGDDPEGRRALEAEAREGRAARRRLVASHLKLVVAAAAGHVDGPLSFEDLVQEGNVGLLRAVERFDPSRASTFGTYAVWWIRRSIARALAEAKMSTRLPSRMSADLRAARHARVQLVERLGREPTHREIARAAGVPVERIDEVAGSAAIVSPLRLSALVALEDPSIGDVLADATADLSLEVVDKTASRKQLADALRTVLTEREAEVLALRFGLADGTQHSLQEVAATLSLSRERIRQIERDALWRLRGYIDRPG